MVLVPPDVPIQNSSKVNSTKDSLSQKGKCELVLIKDTTEQ